MTEVGLEAATPVMLLDITEELLFISNETREKLSAFDRSSVSVSTVKCSGEGSFRGCALGCSESDVSDPESVESLVLRRPRDLDRPRLFCLLPLLLRLRLLVVDEEEENEALEPTLRNFLPLMDAGDFGGSWFGAILDPGGVGGLIISPLALGVEGNGCSGIDGPMTTPRY